MQLSGWKKLIAGLFATVLLGALGSGLWEQGLKPGGQWLGRSILSAVTLGSSAAKDAVYREAAKGFHEASSLQLLSLVVLSLWWLCCGYSGYIQGRRSVSKEVPQLLQKINNDRSKLKAELGGLEKRLYALQLFGIGLGFLIASIQSINYLKFVQANSAYTFFAQSMAICRPYLDDHQALVFESRFAAINGRDDYISVTNDLIQIAGSNHRKLPEFKPW